jgi:hypothetical protein
VNDGVDMNAEFRAIARAAVGPNGAVAPGSILLGPEALIDWGAPAFSPAFYHDLCALVETVVLYDRLMVFGVEFAEPLVDSLHAAGILIDANRLLNQHLQANITLTFVDNKLSLVETPEFKAHMSALVSLSAGLQPMVTRHLAAGVRDCASLGVGDQATRYARIAASADSWSQAAESHRSKTIDLLANASPELKRAIGPVEISSGALIHSINRAAGIQALAAMEADGVHVVPHSLDGKDLILSARDTIYQRIVDMHREQSESLLEKYHRSAIHHQVVPPLMYELLTRCRGDRRAFVDELLGMRDKYERLRMVQQSYFHDIANARSLFDYQRIEERQERIWLQLTRQISVGEHKWRWMLRGIWGYLRLLNPKDMTVKAIEDVSKGLENWHVARSASSFYSLYRDAGHADLHVDLMEKTFGKRMGSQTLAEYSRAYTEDPEDPVPLRGPDGWSQED